MKIVELGVAGTIAVKQFCGELVDQEINKWLEDNSDVEVIDIKFSGISEALIIYRKED